MRAPRTVFGSPMMTPADRDQLLRDPQAADLEVRPESGWTPASRPGLDATAVRAEGRVAVTSR